MVNRLQPVPMHELVTLMAEYEREHPVEEYIVFGWHVWPMLRISIAYELLRFWSDKTSIPQRRTNTSRSVARLRNYWGLAKGMVATQLRDRLKYEKPDAVGRDMIILTDCNRRTLLG